MENHRESIASYYRWFYRPCAPAWLGDSIYPLAEDFGQAGLSKLVTVRAALSICIGARIARIRHDFRQLGKRGLLRYFSLVELAFGRPGLGRRRRQWRHAVVEGRRAAPGQVGMEPTGRRRGASVPGAEFGHFSIAAHAAHGQ